MNKIQFLTMMGCHNCAAVKKIFNEVMSDFPKITMEEIDIASPEGQELVQKYGVMGSPGIIINKELFSTGGVDRKKLVEKMKSLTENNGNA